MAANPSVIGRYQILSRLGEGGMGVVYLAHDPAMDSDIAIKLLRSPMADDGLRKRFEREAMMARRVGIHPNVVTIFDIGEHEGDPFIAMEYVSGETLEHMIRRQAMPPATKRLEIVEDLCTGLSHAHKAGLVHRDIKPANVMLSDDGTVKILDFGVARAAESDLTADGMVIGALNYMSPEQMTGQSLDARSDVFAVGALFYELLSGRRAFPGSLREGLPYRILHGMPPPLNELVADLDPEIERIILRALEKEPAKRYQDVATMRQEIARVRRRLEHAQIERALTHAREAFDTGDYEAVVASCVEVTNIDPDEPRALDLLQKAEEARTGEHAHAETMLNASAPTVLESERPTVAMRVPPPPPSQPPSISGQQRVPSGAMPVPVPSAPVPSGAQRTPIPTAASAPATPPSPRPATSSRKPAIAALVIALVMLFGATALMIVRVVAFRRPPAPANIARLEVVPVPPTQPAPPSVAQAPSAAPQPTAQPPLEQASPSAAADTPAPAAPQPAAPVADATPEPRPRVPTPAATAPARVAPAPAIARPAEPTPEPPAKPTETVAETPATQGAASEGAAAPLTDAQRFPYSNRAREDARFRGNGGRFGRRAEETAEEEIRRRIQFFQSAWDRLDLDGLRRVYPGFTGGPGQPYRNYTMELDDMRVFVNGPRASVHASARFALRSGLGASSRADQVIFRFEQTGDGRWIMNDMRRVR
jgi:eukaryotic-like serine/threonine-protein kinase